MDVTIVGIGNVGGALAIALSRAGQTPKQLIARRSRTNKGLRQHLPKHLKIESWKDVHAIDSELIILSTGDPDILSAVKELSRFIKRGQVVLHTSGSLSSDILADLRNAGCETGSLHPLTSISDPVTGADNFRDGYFCIEGTKKAVNAGRQISRILGGTTFGVPKSEKALYHASAVMAAGHVAALFDCGIEMLSECGISRRAAAKYLHPLLRSMTNNLETQLPEKALTGPFARFDELAIERHLNAMKRISAEIRQIYLVLGERSLEIAARSKPKDPRLPDMRRRIILAKENSKC